MFMDTIVTKFMDFVKNKVKVRYVSYFVKKKQE